MNYALSQFLTRELFVNLTEFNWNKNIKLGKGTFGVCYLVECYSDHKNYCAKITLQTPKKPSDQELLFREVLALQALKHEAIVRFVGFNLYDYKQRPNPTIITEYLPNGALDDMLKKEQNHSAPPQWNDTKKQICIIGIASGLAHVHKANLMHRDIKPANILLDENFYPKLCDFGLARTVEAQVEMTQRVGTPIYMAPELLADNQYNSKSDVYSFGMTIYELLTNTPPYYEYTSKRTKLNFYEFGKYVTKLGNRPSFEGTAIPPSLQKLLSQCWNANPAARPSMEGIYHQLFNDDSLFISNKVDYDEVRLYIDRLQQQEFHISRQNHKLKVSFPQADEFYEEDSVLLKNLDPNTIYQNLITTGFHIYPPKKVVAVLKSLRSKLINGRSVEEIRNFIQVVIYINKICKSVPEAQELQRLWFDRILFDGLTELSPSLKSQNKELTIKAIMNISPTTTNILDNTFENNHHLLYINLPESIQSIGKDAFKSCRSLVWANLSNGMTVIETGTFAECKHLLYVEFPPNLKRICSNAFYKCTHLTELTIPPSVEIIEDDAFCGCKRLRRVMASSNTNISKHAFLWRTRVIRD